MRADGLARPIISTYAVGTRPSGRSPASAGVFGRRVVLPAAAMLGTVSVLAIVFASPATEIPASPDLSPEREEALTSLHTARQLGSPIIEQGFSFEAESSLSTAKSASPVPEIRIPAVQARATIPPRQRSIVAAPSTAVKLAGRSPLDAPTYGCGPGCAETETDQALVSVQSEVVDADRLSLPLAAEEPPGAASGEVNLSAPAKAIEVLLGGLAAASPEAGPNVGAPPAVSAEPPIELVAAEPEASTPVEVQAGLAVGEADAGLLPSGDREDLDPLAQARAPSIETAAEDQGEAPNEAIALHLGRINERYSSAPASEPVSEPTALPAKVDLRSDHVATRSGASAPPASVTIDPVSGGFVIQDDALVAIELGALVSLFEDRLDRPLFVWMKSSAAASKFATSETLAAAGIHADYDPQKKQIVFSLNGN